MEKEIHALIKECTIYFETNNYTVSRLQRYRSMWEHGIVKYMKDKSIVFYNVDVGKDFLRERISVKVTPGERDIMRSVHVLDEYLATGSMSKKSVHPRVIGLWGEIGVAAKEFIKQQKSARRCKTTLEGYTLYLSYFITHLSKSGITSVTGINESAILQFLSSLINSRTCVVSTLRLFCRFLYEKGETIHDLSYILSGYKYKEKREKLPSVYTREEVKEIESVISRVSAVGKRDYAILLLASRLGLRASDIAGLRFSNLDWEKSLIRLQQYKTKREIELPLLAEVGESIISYLKYGRQKTDIDHVFLSARAPYRAMTGQAVCTAIRQVIDKSGVSVCGRRHGAHTMRHSLAARLLENETPIVVISASLGHASSETTMAYLRIDIGGLQKCTLEVPAVQTGFYNQQGGIFYE